MNASETMERLYDLTGKLARAGIDGSQVEVRVTPDEMRHLLHALDRNAMLSMQDAVVWFMGYRATLAGP